MRAKHIIIALAGGFSVYLALALVFGPSGLNRYSARISYYNDIVENIEDLEHREERLLRELESLRTSSERLRLHARSLGYYRPRESRIVTDNTPGIEEPPSPGRLVSRSFQYDDPRPALRLATLVIIGGLLALQLAFEGRAPWGGPGTAQKNNAKQGTPNQGPAKKETAKKGTTKQGTPNTQTRPAYSRRVQTASRE